MTRQGSVPGRIHVIGVPFNSAGGTDGVARAPVAVRQAGLTARLRHRGATVSDRGDVELETFGPERDLTRP